MKKIIKKKSNQVHLGCTHGEEQSNQIKMLKVRKCLKVLINLGD